MDCHSKVNLCVDCGDISKNKQTRENSANRENKQRNIHDETE
jgi:hypothetical protein